MWRHQLQANFITVWCPRNYSTISLSLFGQWIGVVINVASLLCWNRWSENILLEGGKWISLGNHEWPPAAGEFGISHALRHSMNTWLEEKWPRKLERCSYECKPPSHKMLSFVLVYVVGWSTEQRGFGEAPSAKTQLLHLVRSIRTVMRSRFCENVYQLCHCSH